MTNLERRALIFRLATETNTDPRTVRRWLSGGNVAGVTLRAMELAVEALGLASEVAEAREELGG